jgi:hypothetical protein
MDEMKFHLTLTRNEDLYMCQPLALARVIAANHPQ